CRRLVELALQEDVGAGDLTSQAVIPEALDGRAVFVARAAGVPAGLPAAALVFTTLDPRVRFDPLVRDGDAVQPGTRLARVAGPMRAILSGERTALNFMQHLSGIATQTRRYVDAVAGLKARVLDTRKTLPGWRLLEKYAVRCGGGQNHRVGLFDGVLIKDNHLAALGHGRKDIRTTVEAARRLHGAGVPVEVEVDNLAELDQALACAPDIVLLDNMDPQTMREAVRRRDAAAPKVLLEASGGVTLATVRAVAESGVDRVSVGALTHSSPALDVALDYLTDL
ncbi:MAG TPA: carboxylating nicotinate-nucleotide diphosphorylase, partial [Gemmataceae bacterium]|nr:carboxylating nicotinate-nucleotide diphosphorylase [Gemmataceae bacterium]